MIERAADQLAAQRKASLDQDLFSYYAPSGGEARRGRRPAQACACAHDRLRCRGRRGWRSFQRLARRPAIGTIVVPVLNGIPAKRSAAGAPKYRIKRHLSQLSKLPFGIFCAVRARGDTRSQARARLGELTSSHSRCRSPLWPLRNSSPQFDSASFLRFLCKEPHTAGSLVSVDHANGGFMWHRIRSAISMFTE